VENPDKSAAEIPLIEMRDAAIAPPLSGGATEATAINWNLSAKDFWVIAGLHGSGKSDFLSTAAGLRRPEHGVVKIFGQETFTINEEMLVEHRCRIGVVFASGGRLFNRFTVAENVALPIRYHQNWTEAEAETSVREVLELTGLISQAHQIPSGLSPGWQQRGALARALILKPEILLLDKPLSGMDFRHQRWWLDFLKQLSEGLAFNGGKPVTIVATADDPQIWKDVARQFAILKNNQWREIGGRAELDAAGEPLLRELWSEEI
jgi:ABC-type transporter Mla maintaining outer membrane lipid asymmetry ATPase subunit MlaF